MLNRLKQWRERRQKVRLRRVVETHGHLAEEVRLRRVAKTHAHLAEEYLKLVRDGETLNAGLMTELSGHREWYRAIEALAASDGLRTRYWEERLGAGSFLIPHASLVRPDGSDYFWFDTDSEWVESERENALLAIERDWGDVLGAARANALGTTSGEPDA